MALGVGSIGAADALLSPGDKIVAVGGSLINQSRYPAAETPGYAVDHNFSTKYLNYGKLNTGFIVTPTWGASTIKSILFVTANDSEARDPASYELYGTNDPITSQDNSFGDEENWTLITSGTLSLPSERMTIGEIISFENESSYTSYKVIFPTVKNSTDANSMQIADVQLYEVENADYYNDIGILNGSDMFSTIAVQNPTGSNSGYSTSDWEGSPPARAIDGILNNRYANTAITNVGLAVAPAAGLTKLEYFNLLTFTNLACSDPSGYQLFGTMDYLTSGDNSLGTNENWVLLSEGNLNLPTERSAWSSDIRVDAEDFYRCYKLIFTGIRDASDTNATVVHISEMQFYGESGSQSTGDAILIQGDKAIPINTETGLSYYENDSEYPEKESPAMVLDGDTATKYLNQQESNGGFIVTPAVGKTTVKSMKMWTANDFADRDPVTWALYGTDDAITTEDNGFGTEENWTLIAEGDAELPTDRLAEGPLYTFENGRAWTSYKLLFPTSAGATAFQIADVQFYADEAGTESILAVGDPILAVGTETYRTRSNMDESPQHAIDGSVDSKYNTHTGYGPNSGVIFVPRNSSSIVTSFRVATANDSAERDPSSYQLYGTTEEVVSEDYGYGDGESWTLISEGTLELPEARKTYSDYISIENETAYSSYKLVFPTVRGLNETNIPGFQLAEIQLYGEILTPAPANLITSEDFFLAVSGMLRPSSDYNTDPNYYEAPISALDGNSATKYLNRGNATNNLGMIVTPAFGKSSITWIEITTANDNEDNDPSSYIIYGTDDAIISTNHSDGSLENWVEVERGTLELPSTRQTISTIYPATGVIQGYKSWKIIFPTTKGMDKGLSTSMQFADIQFYDEYGNAILSTNDVVLAIGDYMTGSSYPDQEGPTAVADRDVKVKYLNYGGEYSGFIVTPINPITPNAMMFTSANDSLHRSPATVEIYGTDDPITSLDNSGGTEENWTLLGTGTFELDNFYFRNSSIVYFENEKAWSSYKVLFPALRQTLYGGSTEVPRMQVGEFYLMNLEGPGPVVEKPVLSWTYEAGVLKLHWAVSANAKLESASTAQGEWTSAGEPTIENGTCTVKVNATEAAAFYRLTVE